MPQIRGESGQQLLDIGALAVPLRYAVNREGVAEVVDTGLE